MLRDRIPLGFAAGTVAVLWACMGCRNPFAQAGHSAHVSGVPQASGSMPDYSYGEGGDKARLQEDYCFGEMDNASAHVIGAIEMYIHKYGRPPSDYSQIKTLAEAEANPDRIDPAFTFSWEVTPLKWDAVRKERKGLITVKVNAPDHPSVSESLEYRSDGDEGPQMKAGNTRGEGSSRS